MDSLIVNGDTLDKVSSRLTVVADSFKHAESMSHDWSKAVGIPVLAKQLEEFSGNWDQTRNETLDNVTALGDACKQIKTAFDDIDSQLMKALTAKARD